MQGFAGNLDASTVTAVKASDLVLASRSEIHSVERAVNPGSGLASFEPMKITKIEKILLNRQVQIERLRLKHDAERGERIAAVAKLSSIDVDMAAIRGKQAGYQRKQGGLASPIGAEQDDCCLLYTSPSPRDRKKSRMPSSA